MKLNGLIYWMLLVACISVGCSSSTPTPPTTVPGGAAGAPALSSGSGSK